MRELLNISRPSKSEQRTALESYDALATVLNGLKSETPAIIIAESNEKIRIPKSALFFLATMLKAMSTGNPIQLMPISAEMTTQAAADFLGCSRPHLVKLLDQGEIEFKKIGRHRRVKFEDLKDFSEKRKTIQKNMLIQIIKEDQDLGMYDT
jgi:excisionase family DNA binding protein